MQPLEMQQGPQEVPTKKDYERAVDTFLIVEAEWKALEEYVASGKFMADVLINAKGDASKAMSEWKAIWEELRSKQEDYNVKRRSAADALRQAVVLTPNQWRGPDGAATMVSYGSFKVSSVTKRNFDAEALFTQIRKHGLLDRLLSLKVLNKDGVETPIVKQEWDINYDAVMNWLRANKLDDVIEGAYDENESTPQVKGPKEVAFLGDIKKAE